MLGSAVGFAFLWVLGAVATWFILRDRTEWTTAEIVAVSGVVGAAFGAIGTTFGQPLFAEWLRERRSFPPQPVPVALSADNLEAWRDLLRRAVLDGRVSGTDSDLNQMVRVGSDMDLEVATDFGYVQGDDGRPRVEARGRVVSWSVIRKEWNSALASVGSTGDSYDKPGRLVILGDPGYGKTVAALTLLKHANANEETGRPVLELFPLIDWYRWKTQHPGGGLDAWLVESLTDKYAKLLPWPAEELVKHRLVLPIFDGLDDVPDSHRVRCKQALDEFAERSEPYRHFVLTCRSNEYARLVPNWVSAERRTLLVGLQPGQIVRHLEPQTMRSEGWKLLCRRLAAGDQDFAALFRSPLRLAVALHGYGQGDPSDLLRFRFLGAKARLWDQLLIRDTPTFRGAGPEQIRKWLEFLAAGIKKQGGQSFSLHELHLFVGDPQAEQRLFRVSLGLVSGSCLGVVAFLQGVVAWGVSLGLFTALAVGVMFGCIISQSGTQGDGITAPSVSNAVRMSVRLQAAKQAVPQGLALGLIAGFLAWLVAQWFLVPIAAWTGAIAVATTVMLLAVLRDILNAGRLVVTGDPPERLSGRGPLEVLDASRNIGLFACAVTTVAVGLAFGLPFALAFRHVGSEVSHQISGFTLGVVVGLGCGLFVGIANGLGPWLYHHWLRQRLASEGRLPRALPQFLESCTEPERGWLLRGSDAYEFRHRELLDHLAPDPPRKPRNPRRRRRRKGRRR